MEDARVDKHRWWEVKKNQTTIQNKTNPNKKNTDIKKKWNLSTPLD